MSDLQLQEATGHVVVVILVTLKLSRALIKVYENHNIGTSVSWDSSARTELIRVGAELFIFSVCA